MQQLTDYPTKRDCLSNYNPVEFFQGVISQNASRVKTQLLALREASASATQNSFRLISGGRASDAGSAALDRLTAVLLSGRKVFRIVRAIQVLGSGGAERMALEAWNALGRPKAVSPKVCRQAFDDILLFGNLLERMKQTSNDTLALELMETTYRKLMEDGKQVLVLALYLMGKSLMDCSLVVTACDFGDGGSGNQLKEARFFDARACHEALGAIDGDRFGHQAG